MTQRSPARNEGSVNSPARQRRSAALVAFSLLVAAFGIAAPSPAYAEPGYVSLRDALAASETIAIARVVVLPRHAHFGDGSARGLWGLHAGLQQGLKL
jgi:hypothetical protein